MKVLISADIEGCSCLVNWKETENGSEYETARKVMTDEVIACIEGLKTAGVFDVYVRDAHDTACNLLYNELPSYVKIIRGWSNSPCDMMDGLDESFDAVLFVGYHAPSRSDGSPLAHTMNTNHIHIKLNNKILSEFHLNTFYAMTKKVPVIFLSGDKTICNICQEENSLIKTVSTKEGLQGAVLSKHPIINCEEISKATIQAVNEFKKHNKEDYNISLPENLELEIQYKEIDKANRASFYPGAERVSSDTVVYRSNNILDVLTFIFFCD